MTNRYYQGGSVPPSHGAGSSAQLRAEFDAVEAGFDQVQSEVDSAVVSAVGSVGLKNPIINGRMQISQRAVSKAGIGPVSGDYYTVDRWFVSMNSTTCVVSQSQTPDHPTYSTAGWCLAHQVTTAELSVSANEHCEVGQNIEADHYYHIRGKTITLQFWVKSPKTGIHCVSFRNGALTSSYVAEYTVNQANTWEKKTVTLVATNNSYVAGHTIGLTVMWSLFAGSAYQTTPGAWQAGNYLATANQQNLCDTIGNTFKITDVQIDIGPTATDIEARHPMIEQALCDRYFQKGYAYNVYPGAAYTAGTGWIGAGSLGAHSVLQVSFGVKMRAAPSLQIYDALGSVGKVSYYDGAWKNNLAIAFNASHEGGFNVGAATTNMTLLDCKWTADAEIR